MFLYLLTPTSQIPDMLEKELKYDKFFDTFLSIENPAAIQQHNQETPVWGLTTDCLLMVAVAAKIGVGVG